MLPEVFPLLANSVECVHLLGSPLRVYRHGDAPQNVKTPYVTWSLQSGSPENHLDGDSPKVDNFTVQIDCWSDDDAEIEKLATAVRDAVELQNQMIGYGPNNRDPATMRYRVTMTFTFWQSRC